MITNTMQAIKLNSSSNLKMTTQAKEETFHNKVNNKKWGQDDEQLEFLKQEEDKIKQENAIKEELNRKEQEAESTRQRRLDKYRTTNKTSANSSVQVQPTPDPAPVKLQNKKLGDGSNKFKKNLNEAPKDLPKEEERPTKIEPQQVADEPEIKIKRKDVKVKLGTENNDQFENDRKLAEEKKRKLEEQVDEVKIEPPHDLQSNKIPSKAKQAAEKYKPIQKPNIDKVAEPKVENKTVEVIVKPQPVVMKVNNLVQKDEEPKEEVLKKPSVQEKKPPKKTKKTKSNANEKLSTPSFAKWTED